ncbi:ATP-binding protein [Nannocystaceae bacterium ST9]
MSWAQAVVSWSSGKDSAWALRAALADWGRIEVVGLLTTTSTAPASAGQASEPVERVSMHGVRRSLLDAQARALGLTQHVVELPWPCSNAEYQARMAAQVEALVAREIEVVVFGDLFLADVRAYRERMLAGTGLRPVFPLWGRDTRELAHEMIEQGLIATLSCVDLAKLPREFVGRRFDAELLADLPEGVDPCGERGEFHTFVSGGPGFASTIELARGERVEREGFAWVDLLPSSINA